MKQTGVAIIGGGIVGLATAWTIHQLIPGLTVTVIEKEPSVGKHQTGHNSGVIHSGIYYKPGSSKAANCRAGKALLQKFCADYGIPFQICGKVIVAVNEQEFERLETLYEKGRRNGVDCELIDNVRLHELEPHCAGLRAIHVREAGIINYLDVCGRLAELIRAAGHEVVLGAKVTSIKESDAEALVTTTSGEWSAKWVINCAGLYSDHVARFSGQRTDSRIIPFRGEYFTLGANARRLCNALIYPVPDPRFPFLGVHFTKMISREVECGPNAVLALAREGYRWTDVNLGELGEILAFRGFQRMAWRYWPSGLAEMVRSVWKPAFLRALQRLIPAVELPDLLPAEAGVRAQAVARDGYLVDDFIFQESRRVVHVLNAPSPAATASLSIARTIAERLARCKES